MQRRPPAADRRAGLPRSCNARSGMSRGLYLQTRLPQWMQYEIPLMIPNSLQWGHLVIEDATPALFPHDVVCNEHD